MNTGNTSTDQEHATQMRIYFNYLKHNVASNSMVTVATGIAQKCLTRYKRFFEKQNLLCQVYKKRCEITGRIVWYLTTNPELFRKSNQLELF